MRRGSPPRLLISTFSSQEFDIHNFMVPIHPINSTDTRFTLGGLPYAIYVLRSEWEELLGQYGQIFVIRSCDISYVEEGLFEKKGIKT